MKLKYFFLLPCVVYIALGIPLILNRVPPNRWSGYRTPRTLADETVWYAVNHNVGWGLLAAGVLCAVAIWVVFSMDVSASNRSLISIGIIIVGATIPVIVGSLS